MSRSPPRQMAREKGVQCICSNISENHGMPSELELLDVALAYLSLLDQDARGIKQLRPRTGRFGQP